MDVLNGAKLNQFVKKVFPQFKPQLVHGDNKKEVKGDSIFISGQARMHMGKQEEKFSSMIESLMEKRQQIQEMKSNLIERTLDSGEELSTIREQLTEFDEQMFEIDEQIITIEALKNEREQAEKQKEQSSPTKIEDHKEGVQLRSLLQSAQSLEKIQALKQVKAPLENMHRRLKAELKTDGAGMENKQKQVTELAGRIQNIERAMNGQIRKAAEFIQETTEEPNDEADKQAGQTS